MNVDHISAKQAGYSPICQLLNNWIASKKSWNWKCSWECCTWVYVFGSGSLLCVCGRKLQWRKEGRGSPMCSPRAPKKSVPHGVSVRHSIVWQLSPDQEQQTQTETHTRTLRDLHQLAGRGTVHSLLFGSEVNCFIMQTRMQHQQQGTRRRHRKTIFLSIFPALVSPENNGYHHHQTVAMPWSLSRVLSSTELWTNIRERSACGV